MKFRACLAVRVLDRCARCGQRPDLYDVRKVHVALRTPGGLRPHELVVCRSCDEQCGATVATWFELAALKVDLESPIEVMEFVQHHNADPARIRRTAAHFLSDVAFCQAEHEAMIARDAELAERDEFESRRAERLARTYENGSADDDFDSGVMEDDDDLPF